MNTFSPIVLALALSAGTAQTKPTPDNLIHNKVQTVAMANRQACIEQ